MASLIKDPFDSPDWIFEPKLDGYRAIAVIDSNGKDGHDITGKTVLQRRDRLQQIVAPVAGIQVDGYVQNRGIELYRLAKEKGLEGIIAKRKDQYLPTWKAITGWLKIR